MSDKERVVKKSGLQSLAVLRQRRRHGIGVVTTVCSRVDYGFRLCTGTVLFGSTASEEKSERNTGRLVFR